MSLDRTLALIGEMRRVADEGRRLPFGAVAVDRDALLQLLEDLEAAVTKDTEEAAFILSERNRLLAQTKAEAQQMLRDAVPASSSESRVQLQSAAAIRRAGLRYVDEALQDAEAQLSDMVRTLRQRRREIQLADPGAVTPVPSGGSHD